MMMVMTIVTIAALEKLLQTYIPNGCCRIYTGKLGTLHLLSVQSLLENFRGASKAVLCTPMKSAYD